MKTNNFEKKIRVGSLGSSTLNGLEETIRVKCFQKGIECITYVGDYNQYNQEILKPDSSLYQFKPDITFLLLEKYSLFLKYGIIILTNFILKNC